MIFLFGFSISLFLVILLFLKREKTLKDYILLFWFVVITIHQLLFHLDYSQLISSYGFLIGVTIPLPLVHGPFLFFYTSALVANPANERKQNYWIHFLPFILVNLLLINFYMLPVAKKLYIFNNDGEGFEWFVLMNYVLIIISGLAYIGNSLWQIRNHQQNIKEEFSNLKKIDLKWLQYINYGLILIWLTIPFNQANVTFFVISMFVLLLGIFGIQQGHIFSRDLVRGPFREEENALTLPKATTEHLDREVKAGLPEKEQNLIESGLRQLITEERIYTNPDLSLSILSSHLQSKPNYVSQYINETLGKNFYDFINEMRVEEFKSRILDPKYQHYKIIENAYDAGFNSKSSFNRAFRKHTGMTPSQFLRSQESKPNS